MIVGQEGIIDSILIALFNGGHALLEGIPGLGKTSIIKSLGEVLDLDTCRIQFTPDLMPADIIGTNILLQDEQGKRLFQFQKGPLFANIVLADEINRATPKTQSALLEAMQEQRITVSGKTYRLPPPFIVLATQNPIEMEGTYPLPEAQMDRFFFKLIVEYPSVEQMSEILDKTTCEYRADLKKVGDSVFIEEAKELIRLVPLAAHVKDYCVRLTQATRPETEYSSAMAEKYIRYGSSPRGAQSLVMAGKVKALLDAQGFEQGLKELLYQKFDIVLIQILSEEEIEPQFSGDARLIDLETGAQRSLLIDKQLLRFYRDRTFKFFKRIEEFSLERGIEYLRTSTVVPFEDLILKYLSQGLHLR